MDLDSLFHARTPHSRSILPPPSLKQRSSQRSTHRFTVSKARPTSLQGQAQETAGSATPCQNLQGPGGNLQVQVESRQPLIAPKHLGVQQTRVSHAQTPPSLQQPEAPKHSSATPPNPLQHHKIQIPTHPPTAATPRTPRRSPSSRTADSTTAAAAATASHRCCCCCPCLLLRSFPTRYVSPRSCPSQDSAS